MAELVCSISPSFDGTLVYYLIQFYSATWGVITLHYIIYRFVWLSQLLFIHIYLQSQLIFVLGVYSLYKIYNSVVDCYADDFCQHFITRTIDCCFGGRSYKFFPGALCQHWYVVF